jgi:hypothetical protein
LCWQASEEEVHKIVSAMQTLDGKIGDKTSGHSSTETGAVS